MKKILLLLSLALTTTFAETTIKNIETEVKVQASAPVVTREVRTFRIARSSRDIRIARTIRSSRFVNVSTRLARDSRVSRVTRHLVKVPSTHLASAH